MHIHVCNFVRPPKNFNNYLLTIDNVAMSVAESIHNQINDQGMDLSIAQRIYRKRLTFLMLKIVILFNLTMCIL